MKLTSGLVTAETTGPIGWLIWDNPSKLNALSPGMYEDALGVGRAMTVVKPRATRPRRMSGPRAAVVAPLRTR